MLQHSHFKYSLQDICNLMDCVSAVVFQLILETLLSTWFIRAILHQERVLFFSTLNSIYEDVFIMELSVPVQKKPFVIS